MSIQLLFQRTFMLVLSAAMWSGCTQLNLYERSERIPQHRWSSTFSPSYDCIIRDTTASYDIALVLRHRDLYRYNNIWLQFTITAPDQKKYQFDTELQLGNNEQGWLGTGMDDVYEHRISLQHALVKNGVSFKQAGRYRFQVKQIMREDPLEYVMDVGLRVEKKR